MNTQEKKHINFPLSVKSVEEDGSFSGYASVFDVVDSQKDVILRGAFGRTLQENPNIKLLWQHRMDEPIGVLVKAEENAHGLYVEGKLLLDVQRAREAYTLLQSGAVDGMSIGYSVVDYEMDRKNGVRILKDVDLWEVSLVTFPANARAEVTRVKELPLHGSELNRLAMAIDRAIEQLTHF